MAFIKTGDPMPVTNYIDDDGAILCSKCQEPMVAVAINEDDYMNIVCSCEYPEVEIDNA